MSEMTKEEIRQFHLDEDRQDYINEQKDAYFNAFVDNNKDDLCKEFCEHNDDFYTFCREQFKQFEDD